MMFGHPEAPVAEPFRMGGKRAGVAERLGGIAAFDDRREVEDRKRDHARYMGMGGRRASARRALVCPP
jgi:hypothetical protein